MLTVENILATVISIACVATLIRYLIILIKLDKKIKEIKGGNDNVIR